MPSLVAHGNPILSRASSSWSSNLTDLATKFMTWVKISWWWCLGKDIGENHVLNKQMHFAGCHLHHNNDMFYNSVDKSNRLENSPLSSISFVDLHSICLPNIESPACFLVQLPIFSNINAQALLNWKTFLATTRPPSHHRRAPRQGRSNLCVDELHRLWLFRSLRASITI